MEGAENLYIYMKPTDRIFQQTNDTSDGSFFDEYIDNLYVFDDFCKQIKR